MLIHSFKFRCGSKQTGGYLSGVAPDGLLGLGLGEISVPSFLAKAGYIRNSFSLCFNDDDSGRLLFGDQGIASQQTTPFLPLDGKKYVIIVTDKLSMFISYLLCTEDTFAQFMAQCNLYSWS